MCGKTVDMPYLCEEGLSVVGVESVSRAIFEFRAEQKRRVKGFGARVALRCGATGQWSEGVGFEPADTFAGARPGSVFKTDKDGLGYYSDYPAAWRAVVPRRGHPSRPLHIIHSDFFDVTPSLVAATTFMEEGAFDLAFDRAALSTIPPSARDDYVATLAALLGPQARILLVVEDFEESAGRPDIAGQLRRPGTYAISEAEVRCLFPGAAWHVEFLERAPAEPSRRSESFSGVTVSEVAYLVTRRPASTAWGGGRAYVGGVSAVLAALAALGLVLRGCGS